MKPAISVIIPVYNVEKYMERCISSVLNQTFHDYEMILVDDGSPDHSGEICDRYALQDSRIRVIHKKKGGPSDARNAGIEAAIGQNLLFLDSDDYIEPETLAILYHMQTKAHSDIAVSGVYNCYGNRRVAQYPKIERFVCSGKKALAHVLEGDRIPGTVCNKLIRSDLCKSLRFRVGKTYEDAFFMPELMFRAKKVSVTTQPLYNYWHRSDSITTETFTKKKLDVIEAYEYTADYVAVHCPCMNQLAEFRLFWANFTVLDSLLQSQCKKDNEHYLRVVAYLKRNWIRILRNPYFQKSRKAAMIALKVHVVLYRFLLNIYSRRSRIYD